MAWAKVDDQWFASRKVVPLTLAARGLWTTVLSWTCAQQTPHVPGHMARFLAGGVDIDELVYELIDARLWHEEGHDCGRCDDPEPGGWVIHDWSEYQEKTTSEKRAEAGAKGGRRSGETRRAQVSKSKPERPTKAPTEAATKQTNEANTKQTNEANTKQTKQAVEANVEAGTRPGPSRPDPKDLNPLSTGVDPVEESFEQFWQIYPARAGKKVGKGNALIEWRKLTLEQRRRAYIGARNLAADGQLPKDAERFLKRAKGGRGDFPFDDWQEATPEHVDVDRASLLGTGGVA